jgi:hypothetical protein
MYPLGSITSSWREYASIFEFYNSKFSKFMLWGGDPVVGSASAEPSAPGGLAAADAPPDAQGAADHLRPDYFGGRMLKLGGGGGGGGAAGAFRGGVPEPLLQWMAERLNRSQRGAIRSAAVAIDRVMEGRERGEGGDKGREPGGGGGGGPGEMPFTLIQGPPGTGMCWRRLCAVAVCASHAAVCAHLPICSLINCMFCALFGQAKRPRCLAC